MGHQNVWASKTEPSTSFSIPWPSWTSSMKAQKRQGIKCQAVSVPRPPFSIGLHTWNHYCRCTWSSGHHTKNSGRNTTLSSYESHVKLCVNVHTSWQWFGRWTSMHRCLKQERGHMKFLGYTRQLHFGSGRGFPTPCFRSASNCPSYLEPSAKVSLPCKQVGSYRSNRGIFRPFPKAWKSNEWESLWQSCPCLSSPRHCPSSEPQTVKRCEKAEHWPS